jgi:hypothetical protein
MREPLKPTFVNERARLEEHDRMLAEARTRYGTRIICPDCYLPPAQCVHRNQWDRTSSAQFGI